MIVEVLDARDPLGCRCLDVERFVRRTDPNKKIILLLNKIGAPGLRRGGGVGVGGWDGGGGLGVWG